MFAMKDTFMAPIQRADEVAQRRSLARGLWEVVVADCSSTYEFFFCLIGAAVI